MHFPKMHTFGLLSSLSLLSLHVPLAVSTPQDVSGILARTTLENIAPKTPLVKAPAGCIKGRKGRLNPAVHEYLGIPYAYPPTGSRRFAPPERLPKQKHINAVEFGASCPSAPPVLVVPMPFNVTASHYGEDCLSINVWTKPGRKNAPVLVFFYGGAFVWGLTDTKLYDGTIFANNNDAVVVTINYRTNLFGFPNSPALTSQNLGILDQRLSLEWVRDNIRAFGGDPSRITLFGHSAGGASVDVHSYAWPQDPIVNAYIPQSGSVGLLPLISAGTSYNQWEALAEQVGCESESTDQAKLQCMRQVPWQSLVAGLVEMNKACNASLDIFGPKVDGQIIFSQAEYQARASAGQFAKLPLLIGSTNDEIPASSAGGIEFCALEIPPGMTPEQFAQLQTAAGFTCPAKASAAARVLHNVPTWRYRYFGSFNFNTPSNFTFGAAHGAEIPVLFGSATYVGNPPVRERAFIKYLQSAWTAFAKNPTSGLSSAPFNWPQYDPAGPTLVKLAVGQEIQPSFDYPAPYDAICDVLANMTTS